MDDARALEVLRRADAAADLPRLGGMARPDGVAIVTETRWVFAAVDGGIEERALPQPPAVWRRVPLVRGLIRLFVALSPLFARRGGQGKDRLVVLLALAAPVTTVFLPHSLRTPAAAALTIGLVGWMLRGRTLRLHGAEHRAIAAAESRQLEATWLGAALPSRYSVRCGTNLAAILFPVTFALERFLILPTAWLTPVIVSTLALTVTMELWLLVQRLPVALARLVLAPGLALQRLTTREPTLAETRVALRALAAVLDAG